jgi:uncharacterized protein
MPYPQPYKKYRKGQGTRVQTWAAIKTKKEIDCLIVQDEILYPLEFKKTASPDKEDIGHFKTLEHLRQSVDERGAICLVETLLPITRKFLAIPIGLIGKG